MARSSQPCTPSAVGRLHVLGAPAISIRHGGNAWTAVLDPEEKKDYRGKRRSSCWAVGMRLLWLKRRQLRASPAPVSRSVRMGRAVVIRLRRFRDVTGPWHHGLSRAGCFSDGRGTGRRHCSDRLEGRWRRLRPSREPRGTAAAGAAQGQSSAGARNAPATSPTPASPGTWTAPPAGSSTQHQPRPPGPTEDGAPLFAPKRTPPPAVHGEWRTARRRPQRATSSAAPPPRQRPARTANTTARRKQPPPPLVPQHA